MPVWTGAVDSHYLIRSMKTSIRFAMITSTATFSQNYFDGQVLVGEKEFLVQMNNGGSESSTPPRWFDPRGSYRCTRCRYSLELVEHEPP
jgi:hypothetical protein